MGKPLEKTLAENYMNKILPLFDEKFALGYLKKKLLPLFPDFNDIKRIKIEPYKKMVWETTYHVVIGFKIYFLTPEGTEVKVPVVCSAHSDEPRENVYITLKYLWRAGFNNNTDRIDLPRPLFYSKNFNGTFYLALEGENLLYYIKQKDTESVRKITVDSARLFAKLHSLPVGAGENFNPASARIKTVVPGVETIFREMENRYGSKYAPVIKKIYDYLISREEEFFTADVLKNLKLIHGDAHPENIIKTGEGRVGLIDFTDLCLADFARDLGTFLQQIEYKIIRKNGDRVLAEDIKKLFLDSYLAETGIELDDNLRARIDLYYNWTAMRTAVYWFLRFEHNEGEAAKLLDRIKENLRIK